MLYCYVDTCCVTYQGRCHRYFGGWTEIVVDTPYNPETKSGRNESTRKNEDNKFTLLKDYRMSRNNVIDPKVLF